MTQSLSTNGRHSSRCALPRTTDPSHLIAHARANLDRVDDFDITAEDEILRNRLSGHLVRHRQLGDTLSLWNTVLTLLTPITDGDLELEFLTHHNHGEFTSAIATWSRLAPADPRPRSSTVSGDDRARQRPACKHGVLDGRGQELGSAANPAITRTSAGYTNRSMITRRGS